VDYAESDLDKRQACKLLLKRTAGSYIYIHAVHDIPQIPNLYLYLPRRLRYLGYNHLPPYPSIHPLAVHLLLLPSIHPAIQLSVLLPPYSTV
jgi:hypothetical protein